MTTDNTPLNADDEMLDLMNELAEIVLDGIFDKMGYTKNTDFRKEAIRLITDWHNKQVVQSELDILNHLLRTDKYGAEPTAHLVRLRAIQMQGSAESRLDTGRLRRVSDDQP